MNRSNLTKIANQVQRIDYCGIYVDIVTTSKGIVRIGSMPDITKFLTEHGIQDKFVVVPEWQVSMAGDNRTGEEFVLWQAQIENSDLLKDYVGLGKNIHQIQQNLERIFPYFFDKERLSIVRKEWLSNWFRPNIAEPHYSNGNLEIQCSPHNVIVYDKKQIIYDQNQFVADFNADNAIESLLSTIPKKDSEWACLEIVPIGCGNGIHETTASTIVGHGDKTIWIDPCGYPAYALARHNIHWDDITHFLLTHNHEDHVQGLSACLQRARKHRRKINLLVAESVFHVIEKQFSPLFPDLKNLVKVQQLKPGTPLDFGTLKIESRWNHHIIPYGTIGLKISAGGRSFGYSGDTKYDEKLNSILKRPELDAEWFSDCDLVFHEIEFDNPNSVHTYWKEVEALQQAISGKVLGYHSSYIDDSPFQLVKEGHHYRLISRSLSTQ